MEHKADINAQDYSGNIPITLTSYGTKDEQAEMEKLLLSYGSREKGILTL
ncbi:MAG TPA: hypothetical protein VLB80_00395 [Candidatus Babeliales bacterium]|nr:hypothetical protein [Candidatus Babeliales bacterium]